MYGYNGKLLFVDLTALSAEVRDLDEAMARNFVGGLALGARILYDEMPAHIDAFAPESMIGFLTGPTNGTGALMGGRYTVVSKSPVTNGWNDSNSGGNFGPMLRKSGFDAIFIKGISKNPVYIFIDNGRVEFRDASKIWGKTTTETENAIREDLGDPKVGIALIGPAGERLSHMAAIMNDTHRAAGRGGSGAVMGSKKLKALVVRGNHKITIKDKDQLLALNKETAMFQKEGPFAPLIESYFHHGTGGDYETCLIPGDTGIKNWAGSTVDLTEEEIQAHTTQVTDKLYKMKKFACNACPIGCGSYYKINSDKYQIEKTGRAEYETLGAFGSMMMNSDNESIQMCNYLCNEYGYDTISFGSTLAWLMESYCKGLFTKEELDGIDLCWGNSDAIVQMTRHICDYEGIGKVLHNGSMAAANYFNKGFESLVVASGIEIPQHDSRFSTGLVRTYQYDPTPGRHVKGGLGCAYGNEPPEVKFDYTNTGERDLAGVIFNELTHIAGFCVFDDFGLPADIIVKYLNAITGFDFSEEEGNQLGIRSFAMRHAFNLREGLRRKDFTLSDRMKGVPPLKEGPLTDVTVDGKMLADNFYQALGWNVEDAMMPKQFLENIGNMADIIQDLYPEK